MEDRKSRSAILDPLSFDALILLNDWNEPVAETGYGFSMPMENIRSRSWRE